MGGDEIRGRAAVLPHAALYVALAFWTAWCGGNGHAATGPSASSAPSPGSASRAAPGALRQTAGPGATASPSLRVKGAYTFRLEVDSGRTCGWPVTSFFWPVHVEVTSYVQGTTVGSIVFPPTPSAPKKWTINASATSTRLIPAQGSPGPAAATYHVVVDGGRWEAGGPTRAHDGRGEITSGTASGARLTLMLPGSDKRWECQSDAKWSLLTRWTDRD